MVICSTENSDEIAGSRASVVSAGGIPLIRNIAPFTFLTGISRGRCDRRGRLRLFLGRAEKHFRYSFMEYHCRCSEKRSAGKQECLVRHQHQEDSRQGFPQLYATTTVANYLNIVDREK